jgi:uncharacterized protein (TIGR02246 family)
VSDQTWAEASHSGDTETLLSLMTEDVVFMISGREPFGRKAFEAVAEAQGAPQIDGTNEIVEIDWAFTPNRIDLMVTRPTAHQCGAAATR